MMRVLEYIAQIVIALLYTAIFATAAYAITVIPLAFILSLSGWQIVLVLIIAGGLIEAIVTSLQFIIMLPFLWIVKRNIVALILCILSFIYNAISYIVNIWQIEHEGAWHFVCLLLVSVFILQIFGMATFGAIGFYSESKEE